MAGRRGRSAKAPKVTVPQGGWQKAGKVVGQLATVPVDKKAVISPFSDDGEVMDRNLVWRFAWADLDCDWSLAQIDGQEFPKLLDSLRSFESMKVGEIFKQGSQHGKSYDLGDLCKKAQERLQEMKRDDEDRIHRLRVTGAQRLYGFLRGHVFHVVWWDPKHEVFPSPKRNT